MGNIEEQLRESFLGDAELFLDNIWMLPAGPDSYAWVTMCQALSGNVFPVALFDAAAATWLRKKSIEAHTVYMRHGSQSHKLHALGYQLREVVFVVSQQKLAGRLTQSPAALREVAPTLFSIYIVGDGGHWENGLKPHLQQGLWLVSW